jgi:hypothetical protein
MAAQQAQPAAGLSLLRVWPMTFVRAPLNTVSLRALVPLWVLAVACVLCSPLVSAADQAGVQDNAGEGEELLQTYHRLEPQLKDSAFGLPLVLLSEVKKQRVSGKAYAVLATPFADLRRTFDSRAQWCALAILHVNIKACTYDRQQIKFYVGRKEYQPPAAAFELRYRFRSLSQAADQLHIQLKAAKGPFDTENYDIELQAVAIDAEHSFIYFRYQYDVGWIARAAMKTYLATLGRNKVGFTTLRHDEEGKPVYIRGIQGVLERNVMRYVLAIQSMLEAKTPKQRFEHWFTLTERYPRQLVELKRKEYLDNKEHEYRNQLALQAKLAPE